MKNLIAITAGEPESINSEIIAKTWNKIQFKNKLLVIGNYNLLKNQFKKLNFKLPLHLIKELKDFRKEKLNILDVKFSNNSMSKKKYILDCIDLAHEFSLKKKFKGFVNTPISKNVLGKNFLGVTKNGNKRSRKGSSRAEVPPTTFADVAGVGAAKEELQEVVACLKDSRKFSRLGAKLPSGVLLCGPPGTGKTLLAKAVAGEAGVPFLAVSASEFVELFVGRGAARIRELFSEARRRSPCVVFIDELDAVGGKRGAGLNEERDQTLNQLLTELDGFDGRPGVLLLAATNRADVLDHALLRPGRLSRKVNVPLPDTEGRAAILAVHLRHVPLQGGPSAIPQAADLIARITNGFSGAELANVVNEAAFLAARRDGSSLELADLADAVSRTRYGVNGGDSGAGSLVRKMQSWLGDSGATDKKMITQPLGS